MIGFPRYARDVKKSISVVRLRSVSVLLDRQRLDTLLSQQLQILSSIRDAIDPALCPGIEVGSGLGALMILLECSVVSLVITLHRRGMRAMRQFDHGGDEKSGNH